MFARAITVAIALCASLTAASPTKRVLGPFDDDVKIHESCRANKTQYDMLVRALDDTKNLTITAKHYIATNGPTDSLYVRYFGKADLTAVFGALDTLVSSNMARLTFRCDDPDKNCATQEGWAGHWRGENATQETVICTLSYSKRLYNSDICSSNFTTVSQAATNLLWSTDLAHRLWHVPSTANHLIEHVPGGNTFEECLNLAVNNASATVYNTASYQYFMEEVYANEVARPGVGCTGTVPQVQTANTTTGGGASGSGSGASPNPTSGAPASLVWQTTGFAVMGMLVVFAVVL